MAENNGMARTGPLKRLHGRPLFTDLPDLP